MLIIYDKTTKEITSISGYEFTQITEHEKALIDAICVRNLSENEAEYRIYDLNTIKTVLEAQRNNDIITLQFDENDIPVGVLITPREDNGEGDETPQ